MTWDENIDAIGLLCPLPVLKARKRLLGMRSGQILRLITSDPASILDVPHFCNQSGNLLLSHDKGRGDLASAQVFWIQKA